MTEEEKQLKRIADGLEDLAFEIYISQLLPPYQMMGRVKRELDKVFDQPFNE